MINNDYLVDMSWHDSGGYCDFLPIKDHAELGFKCFHKKYRAYKSIKYQSMLSKFDLAPKVLTGVCRIPYYYDLEFLKVHNPTVTVTEWGYVTEKATLIDGDIPYPKIQKLVEKIKQQTGLKFWDCHENNVGYIKRERKKLLVCIDTGDESFCGYSNAWGFEEPGPKCPYCNRYQCKCSTKQDSIGENYYAIY